jgi:hypothetical protein
MKVLSREYRCCSFTILRWGEIPTGRCGRTELGIVCWLTIDWLQNAGVGCISYCSHMNRFCPKWRSKSFDSRLTSSTTTSLMSLIMKWWSNPSHSFTGLLPDTPKLWFPIFLTFSRAIVACRRSGKMSCLVIDYHLCRLQTVFLRVTANRRNFRR